MQRSLSSPDHHQPPVWTQNPTGWMGGKGRHQLTDKRQDLYDVKITTHSGSVPVYRTINPPADLHCYGKTLKTTQSPDFCSSIIAAIPTLDHPHSLSLQQLLSPGVNGGLRRLVESLLDENSRPRGERGGVAPQETPAILQTLLKLRWEDKPCRRSLLVCK